MHNIINPPLRRVLRFETLLHIVQQICSGFILQIGHDFLRLASTGQYWLGYCYENGVGTEKDMTQAVRWYQKSAARGDHVSQPAIDALNRLGVKTN